MRMYSFGSRDMTIKRSDHISVVVDDLASGIAFYMRGPAGIIVALAEELF